MKLSNRVVRLVPSATNAMATKAKEMRARGESVISFTTGEPDFDSPGKAFNFAVQAMEKGETHYTPTGGIPRLKKAVAAYYQKHFNLSYDPKEIITGTGAKQLLFEALGCLVDPGDEVILFAPVWVSYFEQIRMFDGMPVVLNTGPRDFLPSPEEFETAITERTVAVMLNNPNNPSGAVYPSSLLKTLTKIALRHNLVIINDEVYERLVYGVSYAPHLLELVPEARENVLNINGVSKSYAMTGWRLGYGLGPEKLVKAMTSMQGHVTSNASSVSQWAAIGALEEADGDVEIMRTVYEARRNLMMEKLSAIPGVDFYRPEGAFYVFVNIKPYLGKSYGGLLLDDDVQFCEAILKEKGVGLVPGSAFMYPGYVRFSYSCSEADITEGLSRFGDFVHGLR
ncbi:MAG: pyridoxal phosphate-dependent aminotransferase [Synergistaceae bacterium]|nr:pyridoxal phosphate-dependent aminotransferase [Synergistaceae bacterium]